MVGTIEGSWIEMEPVFVDSPEFYGEVYYGGLLVKKIMNLSNTNFMQMQKQEPLLIYTKLIIKES